MNGLDYLIILVVIASAFYGSRQGALRMLTSVISLIGGVYLASIYYQQVGAVAHHYLGTREVVSNVIGYLTLFAIAFIVIETVGNWITRVLHVVHLGWTDQMFGALVGAGVAAIVLGLIVMLATAGMPANTVLLRESKLAPKLLVYNQELVRFLPFNVKQQYQAKRSELVRYWMESEARLVNQAGSEAAPPDSSSAGNSR